ncbi:hypothetical protein_gp168 [Bacillus phage vB_BceM_WH1]|nr:hypothetical protein_gp168 [Bacillus phage vB_BceM_WH1]
MFVRIDCEHNHNSWYRAKDFVIEVKKPTSIDIEKMISDQIEQPHRHMMVPITDYNNQVMSHIFEATNDTYFSFVYKKGGMCIDSHFCKPVSNEDSSSKLKVEEIV